MKTLAESRARFETELVAELQRAQEAGQRTDEIERGADEKRRFFEMLGNKIQESKRKAAKLDERTAKETKKIRSENKRMPKNNNKVIIENEMMANERKERANQRPQQTRSTAFQKYLRACHDHLQTADTECAIREDITSAGNKYYPKRIQPWIDYPCIQADLFSKMCQSFDHQDRPDTKEIKSHKYLLFLREFFSTSTILSLRELKYYERWAVENQSTSILNALANLPKSQIEYGTETIEYESRSGSLSGLKDEYREYTRLQTPSERSLASSSSGAVPQTWVDQYCAFGKRGNAKRLLFFIEYKAPYKLPTATLKAGLRKMDLMEDILEKVKPTCDEKFRIEMTTSEQQGKVQHDANKVVAAVLTQTFHAMIEFGLEYSYITNGEAFVMLRIRYQDPQTLLYHLCIPSEHVGSGYEMDLAQTAVNQNLVMCLLALCSTQQTHSARRQAKKQLEKCYLDDQSMLRAIPGNKQNEHLQSSITKSSPYLKHQQAESQHASGKNVQEPSSCHEQRMTALTTDEVTSDDETASTLTIVAQHKKENNAFGRKGKEFTAALMYCSQTCLLGLVRGGMIDPECPNAMFHHSVNGRHRFSVETLVALLCQQLADNLDESCEPLWTHGARGHIFKVTLFPYRYVLLGKGTVKAFHYRLQHEAEVYDHLKLLQGTAVPVCLGFTRLRHKYYLKPNVKITSMLFLAWGGHRHPEMHTSHPDAVETVAEVREAGVDQKDVRRPNLLWNEEMQRVMLIDFERAEYLPKSLTSSERETGRKVLQELSPNKKLARLGPKDSDMGTLNEDTPILPHLQQL
ncbi:MAG: hypothetical protein GOMPHAMPRED_004356 [Gomphillus americanus]|uniref:Uncharacterized protein n=1 Tax=Gomphillus americanus TaxID=1940652 RepID=A0A8H3FNZ2_9LECA|nr:MAG: hypothetical protein GOMPHAMPRED_004356 [Gomphillus americanus]